MLVQIAVGVMVVWALIMFSGRIVAIVNKSLGMVEKSVGVADLYVDEWEQEVSQRIKTKAELNKESRTEELAALNELRAKAGKSTLDVD
jgi:biopolymer transport protein ExbB/TolQ